jgi:hypothetical protein
MKCNYCCEEIYYGQHVCENEVQSIKKAAHDLWDSVTDLLTQSDIDKIEITHRNDLEKLGIY